MLRLKKNVSPLLILLLLASCSYENLEDYYDDYVCDTVDITYSGTIYPIIDRNCLGCHYRGNSTSVNLETYEDIFEKVQDGRLLGTIRHEDGYSPMPQGGKLDDCTILKIEIWIEEGAQEN